MNLGAALHGALKGKPCRVYDSNLKTRIHRKDLYVYPDLQVICGDVEYDTDDSRHMSVLNPTMIVEVLSPSTEAYTRGKKFARYREIPSLLEYVLVSQDDPTVESFYLREDSGWTLMPHHGIDKIVKFHSLNISVAMADIFAGVDFNATDQVDDEEKEESEPRP